MEMFRYQINRLITVSFGFILCNIENRKLCYYHSSHNLGQMLEAPYLINNDANFEAFLQTGIEEDILKWARKQWPNCKFIIGTVAYVIW